MSDIEFSSCGTMVRRNGVVLKKPESMSEEHWWKYEVPRVGKRYASGKKGDYLYGQSVDQPKWGEDERGEGCDGGACSI